MVPALPPLLRTMLGVTRVARLTGLDRSGVEVAAAVRPRGHVLQVCNGKGGTFAQAAAGAVLEAAELWCAERVDAATLRFGSLREVSAVAPVWGPDEAGSAGELIAPELWTSRTRIAWCPAQDLLTGGEVQVPAQAVYCPPAEGPSLGPSVLRWTSNGMGAHPEKALALRHALLEAIERDHLARELPHGWTGAAVRSRMLDRSTWDAAPRTAAAVRAIEARGLKVFLFDLGPRRSLGLPLAGALLLDPEFGPVPLTAGYACGLGRDEALLGALLEAAQSRLTDVHGAREDVSPADAQSMQLLRRWCEEAKPRRSAAALPEYVTTRGASKVRGPRRRRPRSESRASSASADVNEILARMRSAGLRAAAVELAPASLGIHVVKVLIPSFQVSELL
ncbi:MAG: YcaO-like family protein [Myxococcaceae bacterium]